MPLLRHRWHHLQFRVNLLFATALLLSLVVVVTLFLLFGRDLLVERDRKLVEQTSELVVAELNAQLQHAETLAQAIASAARAAPLDREYLNRQLYQQLADSQYPRFIVGGGLWPEPDLLTPGQARTSMFWGRSSSGELHFFDDYNQPDEPSYQGAEWYTPARFFDGGHCYWSRAYADPYTRVPMATCSVPIQRQGQFWGVATVDIRLADLTGNLSRRLEAVGGYAVLLDRNSSLIALPGLDDGQLSTLTLPSRTDSAYREQWQSERFQPLREQLFAVRKDLTDQTVTQQAALLMARSNDISQAESRLIASHVQAHQHGHLPSRLPLTTMLQADPLHGEAAQTTIIHLSHADWLLAIVVPDRVAVANADQLAWQGVAAMVGAVMLGLMLVGYQLQTVLVVPLRAMIRRLQQSGTEPVRLDEQAGAELGQLALAYNQQQQALQASQAVINESRLCLQSMMDTAIDGIVTLGPDGCIQELNPSAARLLGDQAGEIRGTDFRNLFCRDTRLNVLEGLEQVLTDQRSRISQLEARFEPVDNSPYLELSMSRWRAAGRAHITVFIRDITKRKTAEQRVHYMATRDSLTGLYNRYQLTERLETGLRVAARHNQKLAILFIDLDHFKDVNDRLGHQAGDALLMGVAERLQQHRRAEDSVARLGGDEFAVVLQDIQHTRDAGTTAEQIVTSLTAPFMIEGEACYIGASVGITLFPDNATEADELLQQADSAMYLAKHEGRNTWRFFAPEQHQRQQQRRYMINELKNAIGRQQLELYYQPIVHSHVPDQRCAPVTFEALLRWNHPEFGLVMPSMLIPLAEEARCMVDIGYWILERACAQLMRWQQEGLGLCQLSVNISPQQLQQKGFDQRLQRLLESYLLTPRQIRLEITESMLISDGCAEQLHRLDALGATLAIDDFGTGYSSLSYLQKFPVGVIKLDRVFVEGVTESNASRLICQAMITLGHNLGIDVIAEGVATEAQRDAMVELGCNQLQGHLFSQPLPAEQVLPWIQRYRSDVAEIPAPEPEKPA